jgi:hypothetical protein
MKATKIKMKPGCGNSSSVLEIDEIYISGADRPGYYKKAVIHDHLKEYPASIQVDIYPYPNLEPKLSSNNEKYVRSAPNDWTHDNLLNLPRE